MGWLATAPTVGQWRGERLSGDESLWPLHGDWQGTWRRWRAPAIYHDGERLLGRPLPKPCATAGDIVDGALLFGLATYLVAIAVTLTRPRLTNLDGNDASVARLPNSSRPHYVHKAARLEGDVTELQGTNAVLEWLQGWYERQCHDDWENQCGVTIDTLDNPGWRVRIDLKGTALEGRSLERVQIEATERDWLHYRVAEDCFEGAAGPRKLGALLQAFKNWVEASEARHDST